MDTVLPTDVGVEVSVCFGREVSPRGEVRNPNVEIQAKELRFNQTFVWITCTYDFDTNTMIAITD
jgi:hypothetical protein